MQQHSLSMPTHQTARSILLVDDHALFRHGLSALLMAAGWFATNIVEVDSIADALLKAPMAFDLILLDIELPGMSGLHGINVLRDRFGSTIPVLMLSADGSSQAIESARTMGANGFITKLKPAHEVIEAIGAVLSGQTVFPCQSTDKHLAQAPSLTTRQLQVLEQVCAGKSNKMIAQHLGLTEYTVREHVSNLLALLGATSRSELVALAMRLNIIF